MAAVCRGVYDYYRQCRGAAAAEPRSACWRTPRSAQLSYVVMASALLKPLAEIGAAVHMVAHAFGKITLFFAAGAIYTAAKKTEIGQLRGIGRRMPWTMTAFTIGALSMIGVPPTGGFVSKWYILAGAFAERQLCCAADHDYQHHPQCRLLFTDHLHGLVCAGRPGCQAARRGTVADGAGADQHCDTNDTVLFPERTGERPGVATGARPGMKPTARITNHWLRPSTVRGLWWLGWGCCGQRCYVALRSVVPRATLA